MQTPDPIKTIEKVSTQLNEQVGKYRDSAFARFPLLFVLLSTFGVVATLYGFEKVIDSVSFLADRPWHILVIGIVTLIFTGSLYKKLS